MGGEGWLGLGSFVQGDAVVVENKITENTKHVSIVPHTSFQGLWYNPFLVACCGRILLFRVFGTIHSLWPAVAAYFFSGSLVQSIPCGLLWPHTSFQGLWYNPFLVACCLCTLVCKAQAKWLQHVACNIVGSRCNMLSRVGQTNATLCNMVAKRMQHCATWWPNGCNMLHATFWITLQHVEPGWPNECNMLCATMLHDLAPSCSIRLAITFLPIRSDPGLDFQVAATPSSSSGDALDATSVFNGTEEVPKASTLTGELAPSHTGEHRLGSIEPL